MDAVEGVWVWVFVCVCVCVCVGGGVLSAGLVLEQFLIGHGSLPAQDVIRWLAWGAGRTRGQHTIVIVRLISAFQSDPWKNEIIVMSPMPTEDFPKPAQIWFKDRGRAWARRA